MATETRELSGIPSELSDQWSNEEHERVRALLAHRQQLLARAADPDTELDDAAEADAGAEQILATLDKEFGVTAAMLAGIDEEEEEVAPEDDPEYEDEPEPQPDDPEAVEAVAAAMNEPEGKPEKELEQLSIPGVQPATTNISTDVSVEARLIGKSFKLTGEIVDPDRLVWVRCLVRLDKNEEIPVRDGSGESATTMSAIKRQHLRVLRVEVQ